MMSRSSKKKIGTYFVSAKALFMCLLLMACGGNSSGSGNSPSSPSYSLSGKVTAQTNAAVDWDVNDPNASNPNASNNSLSSTQSISTPVSLAGNVKLSGDVSDFFSASLSANQTITLYIAEPDKADIDLYLYNNLGEIQDSAMGDDPVETLKIEEDDTYIIEVRIVDKKGGLSLQDQFSNYNLIIGTGPVVTMGSKGMRLNDDFVSGEVIVRFRDDHFSQAGADRQSSGHKAQTLGMKQIGGEKGRLMLMQFDSEAESSETFRSLGLSAGASNSAGAITNSIYTGKLRTLEVIKALRQRDDVLYAEPNYLRKIFAVPNDTYYNLQWHFEQIHLPEAWDQTTGSSEIIVAVIDTGVLVQHPDLSTKLTGTGYDFISNKDMAGDGDGLDDDPDDPGDQVNADGSSTFHGTHVAGTIAAATENDAGVAGAGWQTRVMAIRGLGINGVGTDYDIAQGIRYAAGLSNDSGIIVDNPADIINLSIGATVDSKVLSDSIEDAANQGVIIVAAAGNESSDNPNYPAAYDSVISVSAVDYAANLTYYSNFGNTIDVAAPGGDASADQNADGVGDGVLSTLGRDSSETIEMVYGFYQGTSMAAPHVAGVIALMKALRPEMTPDEFKAFLISGEITTDIGDANLFGAGLIDAQKAVLAVQSGTLPTLLSVHPSILSLGAVLSGATITTEKIGDMNGALSITAVASNADWLSVAPKSTDENGLGTYTVTGNRDGLTDGAYNGNITFVTSSTHTVTVSVSMQVSTASGNASADTGYHYIRLVNASTGKTAYQAGVAADNGAYDFLFANVAQGQYFLYAGTDLDKDGFIGDTGELVGAYLSLDQPLEITVDQNLSGLDFVSMHNIKIGGAGSDIIGEPGVPIRLREQ